MGFMSKVKGLGLLVIGAAGGAAASHFLDPDRGRTRRARAADQLGAAARTGIREAERQLDYATGVTKRAAVEAAKTVAPERDLDYATGVTNGAAVEAAKTVAPERDLDDRTLKHKVESEVLGHVDVPSGEVLASARDGVVELRGRVSSQHLMDEIVSRTRILAGVRGVDNLMHLPGEPAPTTESSRAASADVAEDVETSDTTVG